MLGFDMLFVVVAAFATAICCVFFVLLHPAVRLNSAQAPRFHPLPTTAHANVEKKGDRSTVGQDQMVSVVNS